MFEMSDTVQKRSLNPAFKRFQYLPHLPARNPATHGCAAPTDAYGRGTMNPASGPSASHRHATLPKEDRSSGASCEFQSSV